MAKLDYYPVTDATKLLFLDNFSAAAGVVGLTVGMLPADINAVAAARDNLRDAVNDKVTKKTAAQGSVAAWKVVDHTVEEAIRAQVRRIKTSPAYTVAIGEELGIEGVESGVPGHVIAGAGPRPDLTEDGVLNGEVTLGFVKKGFTGVEIRSRRGTETAFSFLARDTESPYVDTRANVAAGPETRYFVAQYLQKDVLVGELSDVLVVTVPGAA